MFTLTVDIPTSLKIALDKEIARVGGDDSTVIPQNRKVKSAPRQCLQYVQSTASR